MNIFDRIKQHAIEQVYGMTLYERVSKCREELNELQDVLDTQYDTIEEFISKIAEEAADVIYTATLLMNCVKLNPEQACIDKMDKDLERRNINGM